MDFYLLLICWAITALCLIVALDALVKANRIIRNQLAIINRAYPNSGMLNDVTGRF